MHPPISFAVIHKLIAISHVWNLTYLSALRKHKDSVVLSLLSLSLVTQPHCLAAQPTNLICVLFELSGPIFLRAMPALLAQPAGGGLNIMPLLLLLLLPHLPHSSGADTHGEYPINNNSNKLLVSKPAPTEDIAVLLSHTMQWKLYVWLELYMGLNVIGSRHFHRRDVVCYQEQFLLLRLMRA